MHILTFATFVFFIVALLGTRHLFRGILFNPPVCLYGVWLLALVLYELDVWFNVFVVSVDSSEALLTALGLAVFLMGCLAAAIPVRALRPRPLMLDEKTLDALQRVTWVALPPFLLGVAWKYGIVASQYGNILGNLPEVRDAASLGLITFPLISRALTLVGYVIILNVAVLVSFRRSLRVLGLGAGTILLNFFNDATVAARGATFNAILLLMCGVLVSIAARWQRMRGRHLAMGVATLVLGVLGTTMLLYLRSDRSIGFLSRFVFDGYVYFVGTIPAMMYFFTDPWPAELPLQWTLSGLYQLGDMLGAPFGVQPFSFQAIETQYAPVTWVGPFNSSTFLTYFHSDGGLLGITLLPLLLGFVCAYRFLAAVLRRTVLDIQIAALLMSLVIFSIKGLMTNGAMFWVTTALIVAQERLVGRRHVRQQRGVASPPLPHVSLPKEWKSSDVPK